MPRLPRFLPRPFSPLPERDDFAPYGGNLDARDAWTGSVAICYASGGPSLGSCRNSRTRPTTREDPNLRRIALHLTILPRL
jgi:hypothetical protein